ncbi:MAG TPA: hypothetical protein VK968_08500, partial [Roseimicrobium sp.]|nr:hypothetical protein [Roseimicrobium sp.]
MLRVCNRNFLLLTMALCLLATPYKSLSAAKPDPRVVSTGADGKLIYKADARGDRVPDFSHTGYMGGGVAIPDVPIRVVVSPAEGDATDRLQAAIDFVARLPADLSGFRGTVLVT